MYHCLVSRNTSQNRTYLGDRSQAARAYVRPLGGGSSNAVYLSLLESRYVHKGDDSDGLGPTVSITETALLETLPGCLIDRARRSGNPAFSRWHHSFIDTA